MRVLISGNLFHDYEHSLKRAFESLGHDVHLTFLNFEGPFTATKDFQKWLKFGFLPHKLGLDVFKQRSVDLYNKRLERLIKTQKFDLILVVKGLSIDENVLRNFTGPKVLWVLDSIKRFPKIQQALDSYDRIYSYEASDISFCASKLGRKIQNLPVGFDPLWYSPARLNVKYDVSFVGGRKPNREDFIKTIIDETPMALIGDFYKSKNKVIRASVVRRRADHKFINDLYNLTRVNLNIHKPQSDEGVNPRFFEILGSGGGVQFVEPKKGASEFLDGIDLVYYSSKEEFLDKLKFYLKHQETCKKISESGRAKVLNGHTWSHRVKTILDDLK